MPPPHELQCHECDIFLPALADCFSNVRGHVHKLLEFLAVDEDWALEAVVDVSQQHLVPDTHTHTHIHKYTYVRLGMST